MSNIATIKNFCKLLSSYDVQKIRCEYDGSGDSGDMDMYVIQETPNNLTGPQTGTGTPNEYLTSLHTFVKNAVNTTPEPLISEAKLNKFEDAVFSLLPGGWEINDGSFGCVLIDVRSQEIKVTHNERYTDVETTERTY